VRIDPRRGDQVQSGLSELWDYSQKLRRSLKDNGGLPADGV